jgi:glycosyltransferase involved in cell wall biosynthesis
VSDSVNSVSVLIPCYNGARFIADALASVRAQTRPALETIVIDDGSRPEEAEALDRAVDGMERFRVIHLPRNRGVCVARNIGIARAAGTHVAFLDCDDLWTSDKLEKQMGFLAAHPDYRAVHAGLKAVFDDGRETINSKTEIRFEDLVSFPCPVFPSAVVMQREALFECGLFDPTKRVCEDLDLFLRFTSQYPIGCVDEPLVVRRVHDDSASRNLPVFLHDADRVYRDFRHVFKDGGAASSTLVELHADFLLRALYARDRAFAWQVFRRATRSDVTIGRLLLRTLRDFVRDRTSSSS